MKNSCIFNSFPNLMADLVQNKKKIIEYLKSVLMEQSFYMENAFSRLLQSTVGDWMFVIETSLVVIYW